jgi:predicted O-methyltransferase YrrM
MPEVVEEQPTLEWNKYYSKHYDFTFDGTFISFIDKIPLWTNLLSSYKGKPDVHYLEIGVNQGRSAIWVLENILTDPSAKLTGIDIFPEGTDFKKKYLSNLKLSGFASKTKTIEGFSQVELRKLPLGSFDIIYIDGDHRAKSVLADAVLSFELLKNGGILIFDDYSWLDRNKPYELSPAFAINSFIANYRDSVEIIQRDYQIFIRKRADPYFHFSPPPVGCTSFGQYVYVWNWDGKNALYAQDLEAPIKLSPKEKLLIEQIIKSTEFGETKLFLDCDILEDKDFIHLRERLELIFDNIALMNDCESIGNECNPLFKENHWIEAESAFTIANLFKVGYDEDASKARYIHSVNGIGNTYTPSQTMSTYTVTILDAGEYILWGRVKVSDKRDNSFFVQIDNGMDHLWEMKTCNYWYWDPVNDRNGNDPVRFFLTAGSHIIKIKLREDGTKLDKLFLTNDVTFVPKGKGGSKGNSDYLS